MPIYEYVCRECGEEVEKLQKLSDPPLTECPVCGKSALKRKISPAGFRLAGGGWYETDFKKDGKRNLAGEAKEEAKSGSKSDSGSGGESKTETKPAGAPAKSEGQSQSKPSSSNPSSTPA